MNIKEDDSEDSDDGPAPTAQSQAASQSEERLVPRLNHITLHEAKERAMEELTQRVMSRVPKTAAGFNRDFKSLKHSAE